MYVLVNSNYYNYDFWGSTIVVTYLDYLTFTLFPLAKYILGYAILFRKITNENYKTDLYIFYSNGVSLYRVYSRQFTMRLYESARTSFY